MIAFHCSRASRTIAALLAFPLCLAAHAQQTPITGQMLGSTSPMATAASVPPAESHPMPVMQAEAADAGASSDSVTRQLLRMQAQGTHAGKRLGIPGQEASASYQRYLKSFEHPIPEFYDTAVSKNLGAGSTSGGP